ncbi:hypothetical protein DV515_00009172 [Chloebia gouldiae]|uniref:Uncharacterized protein n=1 Tax=Chloebia gouldiae TaxID=44316 RepID=A0A3L8SDC1_CHLGU|nr:hypothetical protein DV515_00009172 [Chloebia gouldiae]
MAWLLHQCHQSCCIHLLRSRVQAFPLPVLGLERGFLEHKPLAAGKARRAGNNLKGLEIPQSWCVMIKANKSLHRDSVKVALATGRLIPLYSAGETKAMASSLPITHTSVEAWKTQGGAKGLLQQFLRCQLKGYGDQSNCPKSCQHNSPVPYDTPPQTTRIQDAGINTVTAKRVSALRNHFNYFDHFPVKVTYKAMPLNHEPQIYSLHVPCEKLSSLK